MRRFVAAAEQDDNGTFPADKVDPVSGTDINPHFRHSATEMLHIPEVREPQGIQASKNPRLRPCVAHLGVLEHEGLLQTWNDRNSGAGDEWFEEIQKAMDTARVAILLVSANSLTSKFILHREIPRLLDIARELEDRQGEAIASWNLGDEYEKQGDLSIATNLMQVYVEFLREIGHSQADKEAATVEAIRARLRCQKS